MQKSVGLIGYPLGHSISPAFQQPAFDRLGLAVSYGMWEVEPGGLAALVQKIRTSPDMLGANVTIPYKQDVIPLLDELDPIAAKMGAVNTIVKTEQGLKGYNTDAPGFLRSLKDQAGFDPQGKKALVIGAGGVSRAVCFILIRAGLAALSLFDIESAQAQGLATELEFANLTVLDSQEGGDWQEAVARADLVVNCTPLGMLHSPMEQASPVEGHLIRPGCMVADVVYNPPVTPLMKLADKAGARSLGGLGMLVYQGALSFELWTQKDAPLDLMMQKALEALPS